MKGVYANSLTAHFLDNDWVLKEILLQASDMKGRHTAENIKNHWQKTLTKWGIPANKVAALTVDGGDYTAAAKQFASNYLWCTCHRVHLINKRIIDEIAELRALIQKGKEIVHSHNASSVFQMEFQEKQKTLLAKKTSLKLGVETRWNTYNKMLESLLENKDVLISMKVKSLNEDDWREMHKVSSKFKIITTNLRTFEQSGTPTIHSVLPLLISMNNLFKKDNDVLMVKISSKMQALLDNYFGIGKEIRNLLAKSPLLVIATFLNPRTKSFHFLPKVDADACISFCLSEISKELMNYGWSDAPAKENIEEDLFAIFDPPCESECSDLQAYAHLPALITKETDFSLINWWKARSSEYPKLIKLVRDVLAVPASSAPSERVFSVLKNIIKPERSRITTKHMKQRIFVSCNKDLIKF